MTTWFGQLIRVLIPGRDWSSLFQESLISYGFSFRKEPCKISFIHIDCQLRCHVCYWDFLSVDSISIKKKKTQSQSRCPGPLVPTIFLPLFLDSLSLRCRGCSLAILIQAEYSTISYILCISQALTLQQALSRSREVIIGNKKFYSPNELFCKIFCKREQEKIVYR